MRSIVESFFCLGMGLIYLLTGCISPSYEKRVTPLVTEMKSTLQPGISPLPPTNSAPVIVEEGQNQALLPEAQVDQASLRDLTHYTIDVTINKDSTRYEGHATVDLTNTAGQTLDSLFFRLLPNAGQSYGNGWLKVLQTQVNGQLLETGLSVTDTALRVNLPQRLLPGERTQVAFDFQGSVPVDFGGDRGGTGDGGAYRHAPGARQTSQLCLLSPGTWRHGAGGGAVAAVRG